MANLDRVHSTTATAAPADKLCRSSSHSCGTPPAAGEAPGGRKPAAAFNLFTVEGEKGRWRCRLEEHSLTGKIGGVAVTDCRELYS